MFQNFMPNELMKQLMPDSKNIFDNLLKEISEKQNKNDIDSLDEDEYKLTR